MRAAVLASVLLLTSGAGGQTFEVASIKPTPPDHEPGMHMSFDKSRLMLSNATLRYCLQTAYKLQDYQLSGGPKWIDSDAYDIEGKAAGVTSLTQLDRMMQALLTDRFELRFRWETKMIPGYALVVGKNGPKLSKSESEDAMPSLGSGRSMVNGRNQTMAGLVEALAQSLGRPVADETQYTGKFDFQLAWVTHDAPAGDNGASDGPSLFAALQEQLGLKLEARH